MRQLFFAFVLSICSFTLAQKYVITRRAVSSDYQPDVVQVPSTLCLDNGAKICSEIGGQKHIKPCQCVCDIRKNIMSNDFAQSTFGFYDGKWQCGENIAVRQHAGCLDLSLDEYKQNDNIRTVQSNAAQTFQLTDAKTGNRVMLNSDTTCSVSAENSEYLECDGQWAKLSSAVAKRFTMITDAQPFDSQSTYFTFKVNASASSVSPLPAGRVIRISVSCSEKWSSPKCLVLKVEGQLECPVSEAPTSSPSRTTFQPSSSVLSSIIRPTTSASVTVSLSVALPGPVSEIPTSSPLRTISQPSSLELSSVIRATTSALVTNVASSVALRISSSLSTSSTMSIPSVSHVDNEPTTKRTGKSNTTSNEKTLMLVLVIPGAFLLAIILIIIIIVKTKTRVNRKNKTRTSSTTTMVEFINGDQNTMHTKEGTHSTHAYAHGNPPASIDKERAKRNSVVNQFYGTVEELDDKRRSPQTIASSKSFKDPGTDREPAVRARDKSMYNVPRCTINNTLGSPNRPLYKIPEGTHYDMGTMRSNGTLEGPQTDVGSTHDVLICSNPKKAQPGSFREIPSRVYGSSSLPPRPTTNSLHSRGSGVYDGVGEIISESPTLPPGGIDDIYQYI